MADLLKRNVDIAPVGVIYNITGKAVSSFTEELLSNKIGIDGVEAVKTVVVKDGSTNPRVNVYVFINLDSKDIKSSNAEVMAVLRDKMADVNYQYSDNLKNALWSISKRIEPSVSIKENVLMVQADIFKILGLMFDADPKIYDIGILEALRMKKDNSALSVIKKIKFVSGGESTTDRFDNLIHKLAD